jgi:hypothetical protein
MRCEFSDDEWAAIRPVLPNKPHGAALKRSARAQQHIPGLAIRRAMA